VAVLEDIRVDFIRRTGCVRLRFSLDRGGHTLHVSVPRKGVTFPQLKTIKAAFVSAMGRNHGNYVVEIADPDSIQVVANSVNADAIEACLTLLEVPLLFGVSEHHPDLLRMLQRYGYAPIEAARNGASWVGPTGGLISLGAVSHPDSIYLVEAERAD